MTDYNKYYILDEEKLDKVRHALDIALVISESQYPHLKYKFKQARDFVSKELESFRGSHNKPQTKKENI
jgi:hypothetical protein